MKILIVTDLNIYSIGHSFIAASMAEGHVVKSFDIQAHIDKYAMGGKLGKKLHAHWPVESWMRKGNRELAVFFQKNIPDHVIVSGSAPVLFSTLAFCKSIAPSTTFTLFWPDMLTNLQQLQLSSAPLYDLVASYSEATLPVFRQLGFRETMWLPFAGDVAFLATKEAPKESDGYEFDLTFIGGWRPERERAVSTLVKNFPDIKLSIRGGYWKEKTKDKNLMASINAQSLYGKEYGQFLRTSRINLNVIDDTNYPAANMRFFEVPAAGGLQLCSSCPEQEEYFLDNEHLYYFKTEEEMCQKVDYILKNPDKAHQVRLNAYNFVLEQHNYRARMKQLLHHLNR